MEEIIQNSHSILYRLGKLDEEFRSHISKCKGRYDVIIGKIQKIEFSRTNSKNIYKTYFYLSYLFIICILFPQL